ncbi:hypothetical protein [Pelagibacterium halotolerans]|uniref:hypothetical protein n=1 Tax=Pelagibacterium halotolerans TaxID=531813 RepID=UPI00384A94F7
MAGSISLLQGPFGIAATTRRPAPKPGAPGVAPVAAGVGARLDPAARQKTEVPPPEIENLEYNQEVTGSVESATLFEASLLAAAMLPADTQPHAGPVSRDEPWTPPQSSLALRDRRA